MHAQSGCTEVSRSAPASFSHVKNPLMRVSHADHIWAENLLLLIEEAPIFVEVDTGEGKGRLSRPKRKTASSLENPKCSHARGLRFLIDVFSWPCFVCSFVCLFFFGGGGSQTEWRDHFWRERSHQRRGTRDRAIRALLAQAGGESGAPSWGPEKVCGI